MNCENGVFDGQILRQVRIQQGLSRPDLSQRCKPPISVASIRNHETGRHRPLPYIERGYEAALGVERGGFRRGAKRPLHDRILRTPPPFIDESGSLQEMCTALFLDDLGQLCRDRGELRRAAECFAKLLVISENEGDAERRLIAATGLGITYSYLGQLQDAAELLGTSCRWAKEMKNRSAEARALRQLGVTRYLAGELLESASLLDQGYDLALRLGEPYAEIRSLLALANLDRARADAKRARARGEQAHGQAEALGSRRDLMHARIGLAFSCMELGDTGGGQRFFVQSLALAQELRDLRSEGQAFGAGALLGYARKDLEAAEDRSIQSLAIARRIGDRYLEGWALGTRGAVLARRGEGQASSECYLSWLQIAREVGDRRGEAAAHWYLGRLQWEAGERDAALASMRTCVLYEEEMEHPRASAHRAYIESLPSRGFGTKRRASHARRVPTQ